MAVLSHVLLLIASLSAAPLGSADLAVCQNMLGVSLGAHLAHLERDRAQTPHSHGVRVYPAVRARDVTPLRVLGRCVVRPASKNPQPVLFGSFTAQLDDPDDENLASAWAHTKAFFPHPAAVGVAATNVYVHRAPRTQLERPPRA